MYLWCQQAVDKAHVEYAKLCTVFEQFFDHYTLMLLRKLLKHCSNCYCVSGEFCLKLLCVCKRKNDWIEEKGNKKYQGLNRRTDGGIETMSINNKHEESDREIKGESTKIAN